MLVFFFTYKWRIFETPRYVPFLEDPITNLQNLILPVIALSIGLVAIWTRFIRSSVLESLGQDYIRTARAKGLTQWSVVFQHAFRNAMIPAITLMSTSLAFLLTGSFITERIFNWPGIGRLSITALVNRDFPMIQAVIFLTAISLCVANLLADILYAVADPRISYVRRR
jgi:peptide/nickel transport system permease protein